MLTRFLSALRRFWYPFTVQAEVRRFLGYGPEYVAEVPGFDEHADQAVAVASLGADFAEWERELSKR